MLAMTKNGFQFGKKVDAMDFMQMPSKMFGIIKGKVLHAGEPEGRSSFRLGFDKIGEAVITEMNLSRWT
jgi:hypothetical protein